MDQKFTVCAVDPVAALVTVTVEGEVSDVALAFNDAGTANLVPLPLPPVQVTGKLFWGVVVSPPTAPPPFWHAAQKVAIPPAVFRATWLREEVT